MLMLLALLIGVANYSAYVWFDMTFHDAMIGIAFSGVLGINAVFSEIEAIRKDK